MPPRSTPLAIPFTRLGDAGEADDAQFDGLPLHHDHDAAAAALAVPPKMQPVPLLVHRSIAAHHLAHKLPLPAHAHWIDKLVVYKLLQERALSTVVEWRVVYKGQTHAIRLTHGLFFGQRKVRVDGRVVLKQRRLFDGGHSTYSVLLQYGDEVLEADIVIEALGGMGFAYHIIPHPLLPSLQV